MEQLADKVTFLSWVIFILAVTQMILCILLARLNSEIKRLSENHGMFLACLDAIQVWTIKRDEEEQKKKGLWISPT